MVNSADSCLNVGSILPHCGWAGGRAGGVAGDYGVVAHAGTAVHAGWREASPLGSVIVAGRFLWVDVGAACYALLSPPLPGRSGRVRCSVLLGRGGALRFRGLLAFFTWPGTWATSLKILSLGSPAWDVVVSPFTDVFAGFRLRVLAVGAGELAFLDWGSPDLAFLRCLWRAITKVDSKVRSLDSPVWPGGTLCFHVVAICYAGGDRKELESCPYVVFRGSVVVATDY